MMERGHDRSTDNSREDGFATDLDRALCEMMLACGQRALVKRKVSEARECSLAVLGLYPSNAAAKSLLAATSREGFTSSGYDPTASPLRRWAIQAIALIVLGLCGPLILVVYVWLRAVF